jgi:hypothetical protein
MAARLIGGNPLIILVHLGCPPMTNPLHQQASKTHVSAAVSAQREKCPVAVRRELAALAGTAPSLRHRLPEALRA